VVLTGLLDDGTSGLMVIRAHGGAAIVEDPQSALFSAMPRNALEQVPDAAVLPLDRIAAELLRLVAEELPGARDPDPSVASTEAKETQFLESEMPQMDNDVRPGHPSVFACPDCGGVLWELKRMVFCASAAAWGTPLLPATTSLPSNATPSRPLSGQPCAPSRKAPPSTTA
jgi:two-component system, chemotaxis family, protein-glutamate methylesterase/glutaminase